MYQLESAKVKPVDRFGYWLDEDVSTKTIAELFSDYRKAYFILSNNFLLGQVLYLDMELMKTLNFLNESMTLAEWFTDIGNLALPTTTTVPDFSPQLVRFGDAWKANYSMTAVHPTFAIDVDVPASEKTDLLLTRVDTDYIAMGNYCLVSINGLLHRSEGSVDGLRVREAVKSSKICNKTQVGLLSFLKVGTFQILPMNRDMLVQPHPALKMKEKIYLDLGMDLNNKSVLLSLGGYLHAADGICRIAGERSICIDFYKIPFAKRYFEQRKLMDVSPLGLSSSVNNPSQISVEELFSDETIKRYIELSQSFLIIVDNPEFFSEFKLLESGELPGIYYSYSNVEPDYPMQLGLGLIGNYWKQFDDGKWVMSVDRGYYDHYNFETTSYLEENSIDDTRRADKPFEYADAFEVTMGLP